MIEEGNSFGETGCGSLSGPASSSVVPVVVATVLAMLCILGAFSRCVSSTNLDQRRVFVAPAPKPPTYTSPFLVFWAQNSEKPFF